MELTWKTLSHAVDVLTFPLSLLPDFVVDRMSFGETWAMALSFVENVSLLMLLSSQLL